MLHKYSVISASVIALVAALTACSRDSRATDIKQCIAEVQQAASRGQLNNLLSTADSAEERHDKIGGAVSACMEKAGYRHEERDMTDARCVDDVDYNPYCYRRER